MEAIVHVEEEIEPAACEALWRARAVEDSAGDEAGAHHHEWRGSLHRAVAACTMVVRALHVAKQLRA